MSGRQLLEAAPYGAETLGVLFEAFDGARAEVKSQVSELPHKAEIARMEPRHDYSGSRQIRHDWGCRSLEGHCGEDISHELLADQPI